LLQGVWDEMTLTHFETSDVRFWPKADMSQYMSAFRGKADIPFCGTNVGF
jgi:hypothetical protein